MERTKAEQAFRNLGQLINDRWHDTDIEGYRNIVKMIDLAKEMFIEEEKRARKQK